MSVTGRIGPSTLASEVCFSLTPPHPLRVQPYLDSHRISCGAARSANAANPYMSRSLQQRHRIRHHEPRRLHRILGPEVVVSTHLAQVGLVDLNTLTS